MTYNGNNGDVKDIISPEFPGKLNLPYSLYTYHLRNIETGYIRLVFSDFAIHSQHTLKVKPKYMIKIFMTVDLRSLL